MDKKVKKCISISKKAMEHIAKSEEKTSRFIEEAVMDKVNNASNTKIIAISNFKGGVGKTTIAHNVACVLGSIGKKVLVIDLDSQGDLSSIFGKYNLDKPSIFNVLIKDCKAQDAIVSINENVELLPSNMNLIKFEKMGLRNSGLLLKNAMKYIDKSDYDFIIFDCCRSADMLTVSVFSVANSVYIPITPDKLSFEGVAILEDTIKSAAELYENDVKLKGIFLNQSSDEKISKKSYKLMHDTFGKKAFKNTLRRSTEIVNLQCDNKSIIGTDISYESDYIKFVEEILEREGAK